MNSATLVGDASIEALILGFLCVVMALCASATEKPKTKLLLFFTEIVLGSLLLLALSSDYLALVLLGSGIVVTLLFVTLASRIGWMQPVAEDNPRIKWARILIGLITGAGLSYFIARLFSEVSDSKHTTTESSLIPGASASILGDAFISRHYFVFELLGVFFLIFVIGIGILTRGDSDDGEARS